MLRGLERQFVKLAAASSADLGGMKVRDRSAGRRKWVGIGLAKEQRMEMSKSPGGKGDTPRSVSLLSACHWPRGYAGLGAHDESP